MTWAIPLASPSRVRWSPADAGHGDSIAVNGVCLTVVEVLPGGQFTADVMGGDAEPVQLGSAGRR